MPASDIVNSITVIEAASPSPSGFGTPVVGVTLTGPQDALWVGIYGAALIVEVAQDTWQSVLASIGFADGDPLWEWLQSAFSQDRVPPKILIGKEAAKVAQVLDFSLTAGALPDGNYTITISSQGNPNVSEDFTHPASGETGAQIRDALVGLVNAGAQPVTAAPVATEDGTITADEAGIGFSFAFASPSGDLTGNAAPVANVGLSTDLTAWNSERTDWYSVHELTGDIDVIASLGPVVEAFPRDIIAIGSSSTATDPDATTGTSSTRGAARITTFSRTGIAHRKSSTARPLAELVARQLPTNPGSTTWSQQPIAVYPGDEWNSTETPALRGAGTDPGNYIYFEAIESLSTGISRHARMGDTTPIDLIRGRDWTNQQIVIDVLAALVAEEKIPYTDPGAAQISGVIRGTLQEAVRRGIGVDGTISVTTTARADQLPADVAARIWRGFVWSMTLAGAIEAVTIRGTLFIV